MSLGILAYGSLIECPGEELTEYIERRICSVRTPFKVEFARQSQKRCGAPTLAIVENGGDEVNGVILVLRTGIGLDEAKSRLWRRETNQVGSGKPYTHPRNPGPNHVLIEKLRDFHGLEIVLYAKLSPNISDPNAEKLADLAIKSAKGKAGRDGRDGISYLISVKRKGIRTPRMDEYEQAILQKTGCESLKKALEKLRCSI